MLWKQLQDLSLLGLERANLSGLDLPVEIGSRLADRNFAGQEDRFWQTALFIRQYSLAGERPLRRNWSFPLPAAAEEQPGCSPEAAICLQQVLEEKQKGLLKYWLYQCANQGFTAPAGQLPELLDLATRQPQWREPVMAVMGQRGQWLAALNPLWSVWQKGEGEEQRWETGTRVERRALLEHWLSLAPDTARRKLAESWAEEDAETRLDWLGQLETKVGAADLPLLEKALQDRSQRIRHLAAELIRSIPEAPILGHYRNWAFGCLKPGGKSWGSLLGGQGIQVQLCEPPAELFQLSLERISTEPTFSDGEYLLAQVLSYLPPHWWENHLQTGAEGVVAGFAKGRLSRFLPYLAKAAARHREAAYARLLLKRGHGGLDLFQCLPPEERESFLDLFQEAEAYSAFACLYHPQFRRWTPGSSRAWLLRAIRFQYHSTIYEDLSQALPYLHEDLLPELQREKRLNERLVAAVETGLALRRRLDQSWQSGS